MSIERKLLERAHEVLVDRYFVSDDEGDEYNDEEIIELDRDIIKHLEGIK